ncbi:SAM-dependent chlorinase/fluorinase [bacterium]|nr:SAM-dependent chlorinase/fluorinase [bacterium]
MTTLITLTTDFGTADGYVGAMKGRILAMSPTARLIDISHDIEPQGIRQAAWCLLRAASVFPEESIHVVVVDPGVGSTRQPLLLRSGQRWFVGPDNGVFSGIIRRFGVQQGYRLHPETPWWKKHSSFDGLALFAPAAACLANGIPPVDMGVRGDDWMLLENREPVVQDGTLVGEIILFDRFGNGLTNISQAMLAGFQGRPVSAEVRGVAFEIRDHYQAGAGLDALALVNSDGCLELAVFSGSARERFGLTIGDPVTVK